MVVEISKKAQLLKELACCRLMVVETDKKLNFEGVNYKFYYNVCHRGDGS
jgi:hypothetical protein